jgi:hypothetical protein
MAIRMYGGFEFNTLNEHAHGAITADGSVEITGAYKHTGDYALKIPGYHLEFLGPWADFPFPEALTEFFWKFSLMWSGAVWGGSAFRFAMWKAGGTVVGGLKWNPVSAKLEVYTGDFAVKVGEFTPPAMSLLSWYDWEFHLTIDAVAGAIAIRMDGQTVFSFSGSTGSAATDNWYFWHLGNGADYYLDDYCLHDAAGAAPGNTWPGPVRVSRQAPVSDAAPNQMTPSTGVDHYAVLDERPPSETDYLEALASDLVEKCGLSALPAAAQTVRALTAIAWARYGDGGAPSRLALGFDDNGQEEYSSDQDLPASLGLPVEHRIITRPGGQGALSVATANASLLALKSRP